MAKALCDHCCCSIELRKGSLIIGYMELIGFIYSFIQLIKLWTEVKSGIDYFKELLSTLKMSDEEFEEIAHNKRGHVGVYLIYSAIFLFLGIVFVIASIIKYSNMDMLINIPKQDRDMMDAQIITITISVVLANVIAVYFWMVIRSQYHSMPINRPKTSRNPMGAGPLPANVRPGGPTSQISDESSRGTNMANNSGQCKPPMEVEFLKSRASTDVLSEGQAVQLNQESNRATYVADNSAQHGSVDVSPKSPAPVVQPEEGTPQNNNEGSQGTNISDNSKLFSSPVDIVFNIGSDS